MEKTALGKNILKANLSIDSSSLSQPTSIVTDNTVITYCLRI